MLSSNGNPYLRPEYLNPPPPTTMDSKKSPLALLAQTCSQIGADPPACLECRQIFLFRRRRRTRNPFIPTSTAAAMMSGYLAGHPAAAYSAALQQAMQQQQQQQQQQYGNAAVNRAGSKSDSNPPCRDPYCTGCPANNNNNGPPVPPPLSTGVHMVCTAGCGLGVQCDHLKVPISAQHLMMSSSSSPGPSSPSHNNRPYVCNWIVGDNYCGKRFGSSDDLLQHLRTHTNLSASAANSSDGPVSAAAFAHPSSMMRAAYPTPPLSPLSAARYHPYGKSNPATTQQQQQQQQQQHQPSSPFPFHPHHHPGMAAAMAQAMAAAAAAGPYGPAPAPPPSTASLFQHLNPALAPYYSHLSLFAHQQQQQQQQAANQPSGSRQQQQQQQGVVVPGPAPPAGGAAAPP
ncbi:hypothetical protein DAPPUDRAFT_313437 [Daphnia pulex]|uniref:C2H2-type domain-containing protein n=1 Tax=Daphnia pulex TaxID=6669 RepID=E9G491_DAPPU|nr:hypothetical protein DAPPUDRAFT_313437 [Daphnia pulex]|eukprot:EFX85711.1 hypothetical protein DAPPUDRAFT_313437 [Daphnia pulex]